MRTFKLTLAYDGTEYVGWQRQKNGRSIQNELERVCSEIEGGPVTISGAGRTDAGVHALGQVASFRLAHDIAPASLVRALNAKLPTDIRVLDIEQTDDHFHARFCAKRKTYRYYLAPGPVASPFTRMHAWHVYESLDLAAMRVAGHTLEGTHDFAAFQAVGTEISSTIRTMYHVGVTEVEYVPAVTLPRQRPLVEVNVVGDGFLRHMVRIMVGTLFSVGTRQCPPESISDTIASRLRERAGITAPAHGLFLISVDYEYSRGS